MISFLNYLYYIFTKYNSFNDYFIGEINNSITLFQYTNCIILIFVFIFLIIRYFIIRFGFLKFLFILFKKIFLILTVSYILYLSSDFTLCNTKVNQSVNQTINSISLSESQKIGISVACFCVIFGYFCYKGFQQHQRYTDMVSSKHKLEQYNTLNIQIRDNNVYKQIRLEQIELYVNNVDKLKKTTVYLVSELGRLTDPRVNIKQTLLNKALMIKYKKLKELDPSLPDIMFTINKKQNRSEEKMDLILQKLYSLLQDNKPFRFSSNFKTIIEKEELLVMELLALGNLYTFVIEDLIKNPENSKLYNDRIVELMVEVDRSTNEILWLSTQLVAMVNHSKFVSMEILFKENPGIVLESVVKNICNSYYHSLDGYVPGVCFFFVNLSYTISYPTFYVFNKILGVHNPLNYYVFKESVWYFLTLKMFF